MENVQLAMITPMVISDNVGAMLKQMNTANYDTPSA
jgi:hypothetical protein